MQLLLRHVQLAEDSKNVHSFGLVVNNVCKTGFLVNAMTIALQIPIMS